MAEEARVDEYDGMTVNRAHSKKFAEHLLQHYWYFVYHEARTKSPGAECWKLVRTQRLTT
jgi:hypothetical protein